MASVRMTYNVRKDIDRNARETFRKANPKTNNFSDEIHQLLRHELQNTAIQKYLLATTKLPEYGKIKDTLMTKNEVHRLPENSPLPYRGYTMLAARSYPLEEPVTLIRFYIPRPAINNIDEVWPKVSTNSPELHDMSWMNAGVPLKTPLMLFFPSDAEVSSEIEVSWNEITPTNREKIFRAVANSVKIQQAWNSAEKDYLDKISELTDECNTVKQLLDAWPAAENLLPSNVIYKIHEKNTKVARVARVKEKINFDATAANQVILTAKLAG